MELNAPAYGFVTVLSVTSSFLQRRRVDDLFVQKRSLIAIEPNRRVGQVVAAYHYRFAIFTAQLREIVIHCA